MNSDVMLCVNICDALCCDVMCSYIVELCFDVRFCNVICFDVYCDVICFNFFDV